MGQDFCPLERNAEFRYNVPSMAASTLPHAEYCFRYTCFDVAFLSCLNIAAASNPGYVQNLLVAHQRQRLSSVVTMPLA